MVALEIISALDLRPTSSGDNAGNSKPSAAGRKSNVLFERTVGVIQRRLVFSKLIPRDSCVRVSDLILWPGPKRETLRQYLSNIYGRTER